MQALRSSSSIRSAAALALLGGIAALHAHAGPAEHSLGQTEAAEPILAPTTFTVHNRLGVPLRGFRIRTGHMRWAEIGDLPAGTSRFAVAVPTAAELGSFEFRRDQAPPGSHYTLGAYARPADGQALIDISDQPGTVDGQPWHAEQGSFLLEPAMPSATGANPMALDPRLPLIPVPARLASGSEYMICAGGGPGLSFIACKSSSVNFYSIGYGLHLGVAVGWFWAQLQPEELASKFPVTIYSVQGVEWTYIKFLGNSGPDPNSGSLERIASFFGLGPSLGLALSWGSFSMSATLPRGPMGSFRDSCSDVEYDPAAQEFSAQCRTLSGTRVRAGISAADCFHGDLANDDGTLRCEIPEGSYRQSCDPIRYRDGVLQALCTRDDGSTHVPSRLDVANACERASGVSNVDGQLRCDQPWTPPGPYRASCRNIRYDGSVLQADCGGIDTLSPGLRLPYAAQCRPGSDVVFLPNYGRPGQLSCVEPRARGREPAGTRADRAGGPARAGHEG
jgi:hypothetical protein